MTSLEILQKFIIDNDITFSVGERNSNLAIICGFALYKNIEKEAVISLFDKEKLNSSMNGDRFIDEINRVYDYCEDNSYDEWWREESNRKQYIL